MISKEEAKRPYHYPNIIERFIWESKNAIFPSEVHGFTTKAGTKRFQERYMQEENNLLFGTAFGMDVGIATNGNLCVYNSNALVIGDVLKSYILPNLLQANQSAVMTAGSLDILDFCKKYDIPVHHLNTDMNNSSGRYNPFLHCIENIKEHDEEYQIEIDILADMYIRVARTREHIHFLNAVYNAFIYLVFRYLVLSEELSREERTFKKASKILETISPDTLRKYAIRNLSDGSIEVLTSAEKKDFEQARTEALIDMVPFLSTNVFDEEEGADNLSVETLSTKQSYWIITNSFCAAKNVVPSFLIAVILRDLCHFGERVIGKQTDYSSKGDRHFLPRPVHFYLNRFQQLNIPDIQCTLANCRRYGIGCSVIMDSVQALMQKYPEFEYKEFLDACDTYLFMGAKHKEDFELIQKMMPMRTLYGKEISRKQLERMYRKSSGTTETIPFTVGPALTAEEIAASFDEGKIFTCIRDYAPIICDRLNLDDRKG